MSEQWVPWLVIPDEANRNWQIDVVHLEESLKTGTQVLSINVAAAWEVTGRSGEKETIRGAWQLTFTSLHAYRCRPFGYQGNLSLIPPRDHPAFLHALWIVSDSAYLAESSAPHGISLLENTQVKHYVIWAGTDFIYDIAAGNVQIQTLPDSWARPFSMDPVPEGS